MYGLFAQEVSFDYSNYGVAGALLIVVAGFVAYLKHRDAADRQERKEMADSYQEINKTLSQKVESMASSLTAQFAAELAAERIEHRKDLTEIGQMLHDMRGLASQAVSAKELAAQLQKERRDK